MLAQKYNERRFERYIGFPCYMQPKYNGVRALWTGEQFVSRTGEVFQCMSHIKAPKGFALDGEFYRHGWPLQRILSACTPVRQQPTPDTAELVYVVFDRPDMDKEFASRWNEIELYARDTVEPIEGLERARTAYIEHSNQAEAFYHMCTAHGYEGVMYRCGSGMYQPDTRSLEVQKRKAWEDAEFLCTGIEKGTGAGALVGRTVSRGQFADTLGTLVCKTRAGKPFKVFSGISDELRQEIWADPSVAIGKQIKVRFTSWSVEKIPLNPVFCCIMP